MHSRGRAARGREAHPAGAAGVQQSRAENDAGLRDQRSHRRLQPRALGGRGCRTEFSEGRPQRRHLLEQRLHAHLALSRIPTSRSSPRRSMGRS